jgi:dihydroorotase
MKQITLTQPDDWHLHLRDGAQMQAIVNDTARQFARAIIMPNLVPPITRCEQALAYRERILAALSPQYDFKPLMTLYLTDNMQAQEIRQAANSPYIHAAKLYPAGATTHSDAGVTHIDNIAHLLETMQQVDLPLLVHGEAAARDVDIFDREKVFIDHTLNTIRTRYPELRIVFEHITTRDAVDYVLSQNDQVGATITPHHLLINRNDLFNGGMNPHHYCLPVAKRETHRQALLKAASGPSGKFFAGTDSAPHAQQAKESACGCAGIYSAHAAIELYAEAFDQASDFSHFETFMSFAGADFYRLPRNEKTITLTQKSWQVPDQIAFGDQPLIPFRAGQSIGWTLTPVTQEAP